MYKMWGEMQKLNMRSKYPLSQQEKNLSHGAVGGGEGMLEYFLRVNNIEPCLPIISTVKYVTIESKMVTPYLEKCQIHVQ